MSILNKLKKTDSPAAKTPAKEITKTTDQAGKMAGDKEKIVGVLLRPIITEKSGVLESQNKYVFEVSLKANKIDIARAVESRYGVKPTAVNIINRVGKTVRHGRSVGARKDWKKAIIALPAGKSIKIQEV